MPPFFELLWAFGMIAFFCEFSEQMITGFVKFNDEIYRCEWYVLPNQLQRMYLMFTLDTQQPKMIQGYGNISCTREAFKKVEFGFSLLNNRENNLFLNFSINLDNKHGIFVFHDA